MIKIVSQNLKSGKTEIADIPCPIPKRGQVIIKTTRSLISSGTERMLVDFGKANILKKAIKKPEKVRQALNKIKNDGIQSTLEAIFNKLDTPLPLGYCNVGKVVDIGEGVTEFKKNDRVVSNGHHAEVVCVSTNLVSKIPNNVDDELASFTVIGSIALQGIRITKPTMGECFVVIGLGLVGLLTVKLLKAHGCRVLGMDYNKFRLSIAKEYGAEIFDLSCNNPENAAYSFSRGRGVDGVLITAATDSNKPISLAAQICRKLGRITLVGVTGLKLIRDDFYKKEIKFQVSASYGPGRYDRNYEDEGIDYPIGYVRWTEKRNFEAILDMMDMGLLPVKNLISHRFKFTSCIKAYELITGPNPSLGIILDYEKFKQKIKTKIKLNENKSKVQLLGQNKQIGFIGAGEYAKKILIPAFKKNKAILHTLVSESGLTSWHGAKKFGFINSASDASVVFKDSEISNVVIATKHNTHANFIIEGLRAKKNIFVEKPLCINLKELIEIQNEYNKMKIKPILMVGFNRRFSPLITDLKKQLSIINTPISMVFNVNAGMIPPDHWINDRKLSGGRLIGEVCHFVDLLRFLAGSKISSFNIIKMDSKLDDTTSITLKFEDGSIGSINYFCNGHQGMMKEQLDVYSNGCIARINNFKNIKSYGWRNLKSRYLWQQDKGQKNCVKAFIESLNQGLNSPISFDEIVEVHSILLNLD